jgi:Zn-dependent peptidase ImmA (M78 family)/transcriptional regulator with XRE-family HTH domain
MEGDAPPVRMARSRYVRPSTFGVPPCSGVPGTIRSSVEARSAPWDMTGESATRESGQEFARDAASIFDAQRLSVARREAKLSGRELAAKVGVSATAVSQWESGKTRPRPGTVERLARALCYPVDYFATSGRRVPNLDSHCYFFRSLRETTQRDRDAASAHATLIAELTIILERLVALPPVDIPQRPVDDTHTSDAMLAAIDDIALAVREQWGLGTDPIPDVLREIEWHGAVAARLELADTVDAFSWPAYNRPVVILGVKKSNPIRSRFDAAHELGHLIMHQERPKPADPALEKQAHRFANAFLLPAERLHEEWPNGRIDWRGLMEMKSRWKISLAALLYRARQDHLITETAYGSATRFLTRAGWRVTEPGDDGLPERPRVLEKAAMLLNSNGTDTALLAREARLPERLVRQYVEPPVPQRLKVEF